MILLVSLGSYDMLVTGDSSKSAEREFLQRHPLEDLELLIVGHHGSRYASSGELLGSIGADTAVISVGYNNFGHPTYETLERLNAYGYTIYRTDLNGTIEFYIGDSYD
jgi:competence protein ComEC